MGVKQKAIQFIFVLLLITQGTALFAQHPRSPRDFAYNVTKTPTVGIRGGVMMSSITGDEAIDEFAKKLGPQIGVTGALYFTPKFSTRGELNYEWKGAKFANHEMDMNLHYVTFPLYLKFNFTKDPEIYIYGGGYASYLFMANTKGTYEIYIENDEISETINEDILPNMNKFDAGIVAGLGVQGRYNSAIDIFLDFRYAQGFMNLDNESAELRYNFNLDDFWPEVDVDKPKLKSFILTTGIIIYLDPR